VFHTFVKNIFPDQSSSPENPDKLYHHNDTSISYI